MRHPVANLDPCSATSAAVVCENHKSQVPGGLPTTRFFSSFIASHIHTHIEGVRTHESTRNEEG